MTCFIPLSVISRPTCMPYHSKKEEKRDEKKDLLKNLKEIIENLEKQREKLIKNIDHKLEVLNNKLNIIQKWEKIKIKELKTLEERLDNNEEISYEAIDFKIKGYEMVQEWKRKKIIEIEKLKQMKQKVVETVRIGPSLQKKLDFLPELEIDELKKIKNYINKKIDEMEQLLAILNVNNNDDIFDNPFIRIVDKDCKKENVNIALYIHDNYCFGGKCDDYNFLKVLEALQELIVLTGIDEFSCIIIDGCDFSLYSEENKQLFKTVISSITKLENLAIKNANLTDDDVAFLANCKFSNSLKKLNLSINNLTNLDFLKGDYNNLEILNIEYNNICDISSIQYVSNLKGFYAFGNSIKDINVLTKLPKLSTVDLNGNDIEDDQVQKMKSFSCN